MTGAKRLWDFLSNCVGLFSFVQLSSLFFTPRDCTIFNEIARSRADSFKKTAIN
jgi:hypothetical protein